jgi:hypothetical protein
MRLACSDVASIVRSTPKAKTQIFYEGLEARSLHRVFVGAKLHAFSRALRLTSDFPAEADLD